MTLIEHLECILCSRGSGVLAFPLVACDYSRWASYVILKYFLSGVWLFSLFPELESPLPQPNTTLKLLKYFPHCLPNVLYEFWEGPVTQKLVVCYLRNRGTAGLRAILKKKNPWFWPLSLFDF